MPWTLVEKPCEVCETPFIAQSARGKYCSEKCRRGESICKCGNSFIRKGNTTGLYCSSTCWYADDNGTGRIASHTCQNPICDAKFHPPRRGAKFCSDACRLVGRRRTRPLCLQCGGKVSHNAHQRVRFCSRSCSSTYHNQHRVDFFKPAPEGTRRPTPAGYIEIKIGKAWMLEHRHVMEQKLGRKLTSNEHVHHKKTKADNDPDDLELWFCSHPRGRRVFDIIEEILLQPEFKRIPPKLFSGIETAVTRVFGARS